MCAGSLMSGCSFDVTCFSIHGELGRGCCKFGAQNVSFSMLVASNLTPWGSSSDAGGLGSKRKEALGFQAWISIDLGGISGPPFGRFLANFGTTIVFFAMRACRSLLKILRSESGCLGLQNQVFGVGCVAKTSFSHMLGFY